MTSCEAIIMDIETIPSGIELDLGVASALGIVPCSGWTSGRYQMNLCNHAPGACYPLDRDPLPMDPLSLQDLPYNTLLYRQRRPNGLDDWQVKIRGLRAIHAPTERIALSRAVLLCHRLHIKGWAPRFTEENRWQDLWRDFAVKLGIISDPSKPLPPPWTPPVVLSLKEIFRHDRLASRDHAVQLYSLDALVADVLSAGIDPAWLESVRETTKHAPT